jgi:hypothetical protein
VTIPSDIQPLGRQRKIVLLSAAERSAEREKLDNNLPPFILCINPGLSGSNHLFWHDLQQYRECPESMPRRADSFSEVAQAMLLLQAFPEAARGMHGTEAANCGPAARRSPPRSEKDFAMR